MARFRRRLPTLTALTTFEAVARLGSFTKAASELGVTQAAVSRQIRVLEEALGSSLFRRLHRRVELTGKGRALSRSATEAFNLIADTLDDITREDDRQDLAVAASVAVSQFWLLPRVSAFARLHPDINLRIVSQDGASDLRDGGIDLAIRYGSGNWADGQVELLFDDEVFPVCSPDFASEHLAPNALPSDLLALPLITSATPDPSWTGWDEWLAAFSIARPKRSIGLQCSFYTEAIQAAVNGQGVALGWRRLVDDLLKQNRLVRVTQQTLRPRAGYFIVRPATRRGGRSSDLLVDWLKAQSGPVPGQPRASVDAG